MRALKFRAWDGQNMHVVYSLQFKKDGSVTARGCPNMYDIKDATIMQFTGLKDKNGVEIWEGDVVRDGQEIGAVSWNNENHYEIWTFSPSYAQYYGEWEPEECEVIGNIYETPELLKRIAA